MGTNTRKIRYSFTNRWLRIFRQYNTLTIIDLTVGKTYIEIIIIGFDFLIDWSKPVPF